MGLALSRVLCSATVGPWAVVPPAPQAWPLDDGLVAMVCGELGRVAPDSVPTLRKVNRQFKRVLRLGNALAPALERRLAAASEPDAVMARLQRLRAAPAHAPVLDHLQFLDLSECLSATDALLRACAGLPRVTIFVMQGVPNITDLGVAALADLPALQSLDLARCNGVSGTSLTALRGLTELSLQRCQRILPGSIAALGALPGLRWLDLNSCQAANDAACVGLSQSPSVLELLGLAHCGQLSAVGVNALARLPRLRRVDLKGCAPDACAAWPPRLTQPGSAPRRYPAVRHGYARATAG